MFWLLDHALIFRIMIIKMNSVNSSGPLLLYFVRLGSQGEKCNKVIVTNALRLLININRINIFI